MDKLLIEGGRPLEGSVRISGAKNAALPAMAAALLTSDRVELENIPRVRDIITMGRLLAHLGAIVETPAIPPTAMMIQAEQINGAEAPYELVQTMRASILTLGPLVARTGHARVSLPGGCAIGARPVDLHLKALEQMGAEIGMSHGYVEARAPRGGRLPRRACFLRQDYRHRNGKYSDGRGPRRGRNPHRKCGARTGNYRPRGTADQNGSGHRRRGNFHDSRARKRKAARREAHHHSRPHRSRHVPRGRSHHQRRSRTDRLRARNISTSVIAKLRETGVEIRETGPGTLHVRGAKKLVAADVTTEEYPGFATDMQAQFMALATQAEGTSAITETIFENRFLHASEMIRMGANISIEGRRAVVHGPTTLSGTSVIASDLRASASLVLAALVAQGETVIDRVYHIDRGYERIEEKLAAVGASIRRV